MNRLGLSRNPVGLLLSPAPWAACWYLFGYVFTGTALFAVVLTATTAAVGLCVTIAGLPLLIAAAAVVKGCAAAERARLRTVSQDPLSGAYRPVTRPGPMARLTTQWSDPALWRDLAYLLALYAPLMVLDWAALVVWLTVLAGITLPIWYRYPHQTFTIGPNGSSSTSAHGVQLGYFPHGPHGPGAWGLYVDTLPKALAVAGVCLILFLLFNYVLVAAARLHAAVARAVLSPAEDPLREAKEVLGRPGPLQTSIRNEGY
jgi:Putative sensor